MAFNGYGLVSDNSYFESRQTESLNKMEHTRRNMIIAAEIIQVYNITFTLSGRDSDSIWISSAERMRSACKYCDGFVIGSAITVKYCRSSPATTP